MLNTLWAILIPIQKQKSSTCSFVQSNVKLKGTHQVSLSVHVGKIFFLLLVIRILSSCLAKLNYIWKKWESFVYQNRKVTLCIYVDKFMHEWKCFGCYVLNTHVTLKTLWFWLQTYYFILSTFYNIRIVFACSVLHWICFFSFFRFIFLLLLLLLCKLMVSSELRNFPLLSNTLTHTHIKKNTPKMLWLQITTECELRIVHIYILFSLFILRNSLYTRMESGIL